MQLLKATVSYFFSTCRPALELESNDMIASPAIKINVTIIKITGKERNFSLLVALAAECAELEFLDFVVLPILEYTGSIVAKLYNHSGIDYKVNAGDKITQLVIVPILTPELELVEALEETERGNNGFGSTGK